MKSRRKILVTGSAGFIGANLVLKLMSEPLIETIIGVDDMNDFYDPSIKMRRLGLIEAKAKRSLTDYVFILESIANKEAIQKIFAFYRPDIVIHLAARVGVRDSIDNPDAYILSNIVGFYNILEACRRYPVSHLIYASSSSVYGDSTLVPFSEYIDANRPISLYAATKRNNEIMAYSYSKLYGISATGLRFFNVYGPENRPDMFIYTATEKLLSGETVQLYNHGNNCRDYIYVDDVVKGILCVMQAPGETGVYNLGTGDTISTNRLLVYIHEELCRAKLLPEKFVLTDHIAYAEAQQGDPPITCADMMAFKNHFCYKPSTNISFGLRKFVEWYRDSAIR